jgi:phosphatidylserine/phosphatidylglycerophosphate/cardiolipin synthase-like enzyme
MLIDPLSADPIVVNGSANFGQASTRRNDENMLVVRADLSLRRCVRHRIHPLASPPRVARATAVAE